MHEEYGKKQLEQRNESVRVTGRGGAYGWEASRLPHFLENRPRDGGEMSNLKRQLPFIPPGRFLVLISVRG
jgi:hypothetical protein